MGSRPCLFVLQAEQRTGARGYRVTVTRFAENVALGHAIDSPTHVGWLPRKASAAGGVAAASIKAQKHGFGT